MPYTTKMTSSKTVVKNRGGVTQVKVSKFNEGVAFKAGRPFSKTFVIFKSLIRVAGVKELKAKADENMMTVTTDLGTVGEYRIKFVMTRCHSDILLIPSVINTPGSYVIEMDESGNFGPREMTAEEQEINMARVKESDRQKVTNVAAPEGGA